MFGASSILPEVGRGLWSPRFHNLIPIRGHERRRLPPTPVRRHDLMHDETSGPPYYQSDLSDLKARVQLPD